MLYHRDQGSQYTSEYFQKLLFELGITCSMSRAGEVWDNSAMKRVFSTLKIEPTHKRAYKTREEAKADILKYLEVFYNARCRHSTIGYISPIKFEQALLA